MNANNKLLQICLLGQFSLKYGEKAVTGIETQSYQSLLAYLLLNRDKVHNRRQLAFQFWPDSTESQARTNLRKAIYHLRHTLPEADRFLLLKGQTVQWNSNTLFMLDVVLFEQCLKTNDQAPEKHHLQKAITLYLGDFMPNHYDEWILFTREKLRQKYLTCLDTLIGHLENERQYQQAIHYARRLLREDPLHEATYRRLMRLQALAGNVAGALRVYHACVTALQHELDISPSQATKETYKRLLQIEAPAESPFPARIPLVAREKEWSKIHGIWKQANSQRPQVVLLKGEAGIGKTRLAEELIDWASRQGIPALTAVCYPSEKQLAYAPVAKWLRSETLQPIFRQRDNQHLVECSRLLPELQNQFPDLPVPGPLKESWQRHRFFNVLAQTFFNLRQPFLLFIDDITWCDQDTLDWLLFLFHYDPQARFLLLCTGRTEEIDLDHELIPWQQQLDRESQFTKINLTRLDAGASARLAGHVLKKELEGQQAVQLFAETEGNPLFIVEMARSGLTHGLSPFHAFALPPKVQAVIESRLTSLTPAAFELAQLAAVIGHSFTFQILQHVSTFDEDKLIHSLDELWQHRIVREREVEAYDFSHDKIRQVAYESLSGVRRRQWHQRVWQALAAIHADNLDPVSGQIAQHCEAASHYNEAVVYYQRAAMAAQAVYANQDTVRYLKRAIDLFSLGAVENQQQVEIYRQLGEVLVTLGRYEEADDVLNTAVSLTKDPWQLTRIWQAAARVYELRRQYCQAHLALDNAEIALQKSSQTTLKAWQQDWLNIRLKRLDLYYFTNQIEEMTILGDEIQSVVEKYGSAKQLVYFYRFLTRLGFRQERYALSQETAANAEKAYAAAVESGNLELLANSRFALAFANLWLGWEGNLDKAESHLQKALDLAEEMGDVLLQARCLNYLAVLYRRRGDPMQVSILLPKALKAAEEGNLQEYIATVEANLAWLEWQEGNLISAKKHGLKALAIWQELPIVFPLQWLAIWPLIDIALNQNEPIDAVDYAHLLLRPDMCLLHPKLTSILQKAVLAGNNDDSNESENPHFFLHKALQHARELGQL